MSRPKIRISKTKSIPRPNIYIQALFDELKGKAFIEEEGPLFKGKWRQEAFGVAEENPLDLEIGTGNGLFFSHHAVSHPQRSLLGIELKYKPLVQSIRRALRNGAENARILRYNARLIEDLFVDGELNDVYVHFPDPYLKKRLRKMRLLTRDFLVQLHDLQRPGALLDFKTDSEDLFDWAMGEVKDSPYEVAFLSRDTHGDEGEEERFITAFERIFINQGLPIYSAKMRRP